MGNRVISFRQTSNPHSKLSACRQNGHNNDSVRLAQVPRNPFRRFSQYSVIAQNIFRCRKKMESTVNILCHSKMFFFPIIDFTKTQVEKIPTFAVVQAKIIFFFRCGPSRRFITFFFLHFCSHSRRMASIETSFIDSHSDT